MKNSFGNYVVQKALKLSNGFLKVKLINNIKKNIEKINDKKLIDKWKSIIANSTTTNLLFQNKQTYGSPGYTSPVESNSPNSSFNSYNSFNSQGSFQQPFIIHPNLIMGPVQNRFYSKIGTNSPTCPNNMPMSRDFIYKFNLK